MSELKKEVLPAKTTTVWRHKKKGTLYIGAGKCKVQHYGVWKPAVLYQEIKTPPKHSLDKSITILPEVYCRAIDDFQKKFMAAGEIQGEEKT